MNKFNRLAQTLLSENPNADQIEKKTDYSSQIKKNLEDKNKSKEYIQGYLDAIYDGLRFKDKSEVPQYMENAVNMSSKQPVYYSDVKY